MIKADDTATMTITGDCAKCGSRKATHIEHKRFLCCVCFVEEGNPPTDWHPRCMETYKEIQK